MALLSKGLSRVFTNTIVQISHPYMTTGKTIALTRWTFVGKEKSLLLNMLSMLVIAFLPRSKHLLISWLKSSSAVILEPKVSHCVHYFPIYFHEMMGTNAMALIFWILTLLNVDLVFWMLNAHWLWLRPWTTYCQTQT